MKAHHWMGALLAVVFVLMAGDAFAFDNTFLGASMNVLLGIYFISMAIVVIFAFTNKEERGMKVGKVTLSTVVITIVMAAIPVVNTIVVIGAIGAELTNWKMTKKMSKKD